MSSSSDQPTRFATIGRRQIIGAAAALVIAPAAVAAAYAKPSSQDATPGATPGTPGATPEGTPVSGTPAAAAATGSTALDISMIDLAFEPKDASIAAGTDVTINVTNDGVLPHNYTVVNTEFATQTFNGGMSEALVVNLPAGSYMVECTVPGHAAAGMVGTLTVA